MATDQTKSWMVLIPSVPGAASIPIPGTYPSLEKAQAAIDADPDLVARKAYPFPEG